MINLLTSNRTITHQNLSYLIIIISSLLDERIHDKLILEKNISQNKNRIGKMEVSLKKNNKMKII